MRTLVSWSGGKDSAILLDQLLNDRHTEVCGLFTTFSGEEAEVNLHHVSESLIRAQSKALGIPLYPVYISAGASNAEYEKAHRDFLQEAKHSLQVSAVAFGDIFLEEIRKYRENLVAPTALEALFPLWGKQSRDIVELFLNKGYEAVCVAAEAKLPGKLFAGKKMDRAFFDALPSNADPCGENGEFHSFVYNGPAFSSPVKVSAGEITYIDYNPAADMQMNLSALALK